METAVKKMTGVKSGIKLKFYRWVILTAPPRVRPTLPSPELRGALSEPDMTPSPPPRDAAGGVHRRDRGGCAQWYWVITGSVIKKQLLFTVFPQEQQHVGIVWQPHTAGDVGGLKTVPRRGFLPLFVHEQPGANSAALVPGGGHGRVLKSFI